MTFREWWKKPIERRDVWAFIAGSASTILMPLYWRAMDNPFVWICGSCIGLILILNDLRYHLIK
jgi:hypothetical protein